MKLKKKQTENVTIRVLPDTQDWLAKNFESRGTGSGFCVEAMRHLYTNTIRGLRGTFTAGELKLFCDIMNGTLVMPQITGHVFANVSDCGPDGTPEKWGVDLKTVCEKLNSLSGTEHLCLDIWASGFWVSGFYEKHPVEKWVETLQ